MKPIITILTITFALISIGLSMASIMINVKASRRFKQRLAELIKAIADLYAEIISSEAFEDLCAEIREIYYQQPPAKIPPKTIDPTVHPPMQRIMPRARSQLRCTKRR